MQNLKKVHDIISNDNIEVVSFDIFDTLIQRPFLEPTDLFYIWSGYVNKYLGIEDEVDFQSIRIRAEVQVRSKHSCEITLDEIYDELGRILNVSECEKNYLKNLEVELELKYCMAKPFGKNLYDFAIQKSKKVIITSDMYLSEKIVKNILNHNGFDNYDKLYLSSSIKKTKAEGTIYNYIENDLKIKANAFLHFGDNYFTDYENALKSGWNAVYLPRAVDIFQNKIPNMFSGNIYKDVYSESYVLRRGLSCLQYFGLRCMLGIVANKVCGDPLHSFSDDTDFDCNPYYIGYYALGMHVFAIAEWLHDELQNKHFDNFNFMARDGYLVMEAFKILNRIIKNNVIINYLPLTRKVVLPLSLVNDRYLGETLLKNVKDIFNKSPKDICSLLYDELLVHNMRDIEKLFHKHGIQFTENLKNIDNVYKFANILKNGLLSVEKIERYKENMKNFLRNYYSGHVATFDCGYHLRGEALLRSIFGYDITAYYICMFDNISFARKKKYNIAINTFYDYSLGTCCMRELLLSSYSASCKKIDFSGKEVVYIHEDSSHDEKEIFLIDTIQNAALDFVKDIVNIFDRDLEYLHFHRTDASLPFDYFITSPKQKEMEMFSIIAFQDFSVDYQMQPITSLWKREIEGCSKTNLVKNIVKTKLRDKPLLYKTLRVMYKIMKKYRQ